MLLCYRTWKTERVNFFFVTRCWLLSSRCFLLAVRCLLVAFCSLLVIFSLRLFALILSASFMLLSAQCLSLSALRVLLFVCCLLLSVRLYYWLVVACFFARCSLVSDVICNIWLTSFSLKILSHFWLLKITCNLFLLLHFSES